MDGSEALLEVLLQLSDQGAFEGDCSCGPADLEAARQCVEPGTIGPEFWHNAAQQSVSMSNISKALGGSFNSSTPAASANMLNAAFYACLLRLPGCPVCAALQFCTRPPHSLPHSSTQHLRPHLQLPPQPYMHP